MSSEDPSPPAQAIPWYESAIIRRLSVSLVTQLLALTHLSKYLTRADVADLVDAGLQIAGLALAAYAVRARVKSTVEPVTRTRAQADAINNGAPK